MTREQLLHAIRAACVVADEKDLFVFGSQAILASIDSDIESLTRSIEIDVSPVRNPSKVHLIDGALGEGSAFHQTHGFYVHGVSIETAILPEGWKSRCLAVSDSFRPEFKGHCLEIHDLAVSKLMAFREKDRVFVSTLLSERLIQAPTLARRIHETTTHQALIDRAHAWVERTTRLFAL